MIAMECSDFEVVQTTISGERKMDETTLCSVAILAERLERLKRKNSIFAGISFSPAVEELVEYEMVSALS